MTPVYRHLAVLCLCLMTYAQAWAQQAVIAVVSPESSGVYRELIEAMRGEIERQRPGQITFAVGATPPSPSSPAPRLVVTVGVVALTAALEARENSTPILATLIPRLRFERETLRFGRTTKISAIVIDQPASRQAALIRAALPKVRRVGLLLGPESKLQATSLSSALAEHDMSPFVREPGKGGLFSALQDVLEESDALLAVADATVFNSESITNILTAAYRRQIPLVGFSPSYVKAGAVLGLYATPTQMGRAAAIAALAAINGDALPSPAPARQFSIEINQAVARSLGLSLDEDQIRKRMHALESRK